MYWNRETFSVLDALTHETASIMEMDWNKKFFSVVVGGVYDLRIKKVIDSLPLGEEGPYVPDMDTGVEAELADGYNCTICM